MNGAILTVTDLSVRLGQRTIIDRVSLSVKSGEMIAIAGPNGAGKTTLLRAAAGLIAATGVITLGGDPLDRLSLAERARRRAYLPQGHVIHWPLPAAEVVALGRIPRGAGADLSLADLAAVDRAMNETGIAEFAGRPVTTLSGGERARVALARVVATEAPLILADEPTASLDPRYQLLVMDTLRRHAAAGGAVVAVLHDLALAARFADRVVLIEGGCVVADGPPGEVFAQERLASVFGIEVAVADIAGMPVVVPIAVRQP